MEHAKNQVTNIVSCQQVRATTSTIAWMEALYEAGLVFRGKEGNVILNEEVRQLVAAMHAVLSGGEISLEIVNRGGSRFFELEDEFEDALAQVSSVYMDEGVAMDDIAPLMP